MEPEIEDVIDLVEWALQYAPEVVTVDLEALRPRLMLDDEHLGGYRDMHTGMVVPGIRVKREDALR